MTQIEALEKVQKLMALSKSDNANEAALAMATAQRIMDQYKLDAAMLEDSESIEEVEVSPDPLETVNSNWKRILGNLVAQCNNCRAYLEMTSRNLNLVGRKSDVQAVRYLYKYFVREIDRLTDLQEGDGTKTWFNNFRLGVVETLTVRLMLAKKDFQQTAQANGQGTALVRVNQAAQDASDYLKKMGTKKISMKVRPDAEAREAGRIAGESIRLAGDSKEIGAGQKVLVA